LRDGLRETIRWFESNAKLGHARMKIRPGFEGYLLH